MWFTLFIYVNYEICMSESDKFVSFFAKTDKFVSDNIYAVRFILLPTWFNAPISDCDGSGKTYFF